MLFFHFSFFYFLDFSFFAPRFLPSPHTKYDSLFFFFVSDSEPSKKKKKRAATFAIFAALSCPFFSPLPRSSLFSSPPFLHISFSLFSYSLFLYSFLLLFLLSPDRHLQIFLLYPLLGSQHLTTTSRSIYHSTISYLIQSYPHSRRILPCSLPVIDLLGLAFTPTGHFFLYASA